MAKLVAFFKKVHGRQATITCPASYTIESASERVNLRRYFKKLYNKTNILRLFATEHTALGKRLLHQLKNNYSQIVSVGSLFKGFLTNNNTTSYFY